MTIIKPIILAALLLITLNRAGAVTKITSLPYTITKSGNYELAGNLTAAANADGIDVKASNVVINLNGFSMSSTGYGFGVRDDIYSNVVVYNGTISGFYYGVALGNAGEENNLELQNVRVLGATAGVRMTGSDAIVENCSIIGTGVANTDGVGVMIGGVNDEIRNCYISEMAVAINSQTGIGGGGFFHNTIASCTYGMALQFYDYYQGNVVTNSTQAFQGGNAVGTENGGF
jgi:hypothetical protein